MYEPKSNIKKRLENFGIDTGTHDFLSPHLVVYDTEASLPPTTVEPVAKWAKMCTDVHGYQVKWKLKSTQELLSYLMATNAQGFKEEEMVTPTKM